ncbi:hypothetical protein Q5P01_024808 [Channa striata]|uniref:HMG box domain-containing protein n=1 Tax=Channa striata TaxID=64152 RepID=A0AA88ISY4_CHASR|nr:hypothetical protein Q5P01_024808 [Channa striata]
MEWGEVLDSLQAAIEGVFGTSANTSPPTPPAPGLPTELGHDVHPQPAGDVHEAHQQRQRATLPLDLSSVSDHGGPSTAASYHAHVTRHRNGELVYAYTFHHPDSAAPPAPTSMSKKRKRRYDKPQDDDRPYVKKPLNAFMLFMKEQRQNVVAEINNRNNATVNRILGQRGKKKKRQRRKVPMAENTISSGLKY